ncbi:MAG TPA: helix-turn-helix transcriptional regulator [Candidatus Sabulitectum sp.]|nr:helix-turn-helix transcriptional regulator [Candidatus Sabulitectum sp.]HPR22707.1 helix-turn-helix transcriptional regulator [Candidatus Sabulitectum sp.]
MENRLLLLGLLHSSEMHGYRMNDFLQNGCINTIGLKKANAYRLLEKMEGEGLVSHKTEREGGRPSKRVYSLTSKGEEALLELLRENLRSFRTPHFPSLTGLNFIGLLPPREAASLLSEKLQLLKTELEEVEKIPAQVRKAHPSMEYLLMHYSREIEWLKSFIAELGN